VLQERNYHYNFAHKLHAHVLLHKCRSHQMNRNTFQAIKLFSKASVSLPYHAIAQYKCSKAILSNAYQNKQILCLDIPSHRNIHRCRSSLCMWPQEDNRSLLQVHTHQYLLSNNQNKWCACVNGFVFHFFLHIVLSAS